MFKYFVGLVLIVALAGCNQSYYTPVVQNVLLFKEKNEVNI